MNVPPYEQVMYLIRTVQIHVTDTPLRRIKLYVFCVFFCSYLFFLYEQNVKIYCENLAQLILTTYLKHIGVPVEELIPLLRSVIPAKGGRVH